MSTDTFRFKHFTIHQERTAMKVGTDGVLLGAWAPLATARRILDIGTGTGLIALMAAQRAPQAVIEAVEIEAEATAQAEANVAASAWGDRIHIHHTDFEQYAAAEAERGGTFDVIVSNPPFFTETLKSADAGRAMARHADSLPFAQLMAGSARLLTPDGALALIYPYTADGDVQTAAISARLYCSDLCEVHTTPRKAPKRLMAIFRHTAPSYVFRRTTLNLHDATGALSAEYQTLTSEFYL
jgi:tRNA1Val (adenine37-N6)-methyltransferase